ncbi:MAG: sigma-70 family RNA polymerase sigma factor [Bacteroidota bacterium]
MTEEMQKEAFVELVEKNQGIIHKVCNMYCDSSQDRNDLFQEILLQLWRSYAHFRGDSRISTWMYRVALNTAISGLRKRKRREVEQGLTDREFELAASGPDREQEEKKKFLYEAIKLLSDVEKAIIMLHLEEHSYDEIASIIGITSNHVGVKINRIKGKLKKILLPHFT